MDKQKRRALRYALLYRAWLFGLLLVRILPRRTGIALFGAVGSLVFCVPHPDRERTLRHLRLIYGAKWNERRIRRTACGVYSGLGRNLFDAFALQRMSRQQLDRIVTSEPLDSVRNAYDEGRGVITITAHTGCFEMLLHYFPAIGFRCFAIGRKLHDKRLDEILRKARSGDDIVYMDRSEPPRNILRNLREGRLFGVLIDQDTSVEGVYAPFLGRQAHTPSGPVKMAMKMGVPLFVITTARVKGDKHQVYVRGPLALRSGGDFEADLIHNVAMVNEHISATIEKHPEQWVWMHERWRRQPKAVPV